MSRRVKDFVEVKDHISLDALIERLVGIRRAMTNDAEPVVTMKGDDVFGRLLSISYWRAQTVEEAATEERYALVWRRRRPEGQAEPRRLRSAA